VKGAAEGNSRMSHLVMVISTNPRPAKSPIFFRE
jgi:hypothetical protein